MSTKFDLGEVAVNKQLTPSKNNFPKLRAELRKVFLLVISTIPEELRGSITNKLLEILSILDNFEEGRN